jgi:hypothetical protein
MRHFNLHSPISTLLRTETPKQFHQNYENGILVLLGYFGN